MRQEKFALLTSDLQYTRSLTDTVTSHGPHSHSLGKIVAVMGHHNSCHLLSLPPRSMIESHGDFNFNIHSTHVSLPILLESFIENIVIS